MSRIARPAAIIPQPHFANATERYRAVRRSDGRFAVLDLERPLGAKTVAVVDGEPAAELALARLVAGCAP
jgi:hypothetical protein